jgi:hypothetical protein
VEESSEVNDPRVAWCEIGASKVLAFKNLELAETTLSSPREEDVRIERICDLWC